MHSGAFWGELFRHYRILENICSFVWDLNGTHGIVLEYKDLKQNEIRLP